MGGGTGIGRGCFDPFLTIPRNAERKIFPHRLPSSSSSSCSRVNLSNSDTSKSETEDCTRSRRTSLSSYKNNIFSSVPSKTEIENAISDLQRLMLALYSSSSEHNQDQNNLYGYDPNMEETPECRRIQDALHMLHSEPPIQKMIISISSDQAVWDAILNNKAVQDYCGSLCKAKDERTEKSKEELDIVNLILKRILDIARAKVIELIDTLRSFVYEVFQFGEKEMRTSELSYFLEEKVRSSLFLSIMVLMIVVVSRGHQ